MYNVNYVIFIEKFEISTQNSVVNICRAKLKRLCQYMDKSLLKCEILGSLSSFLCFQ